LASVKSPSLSDKETIATEHRFTVAIELDAEPETKGGFEN
jgi:hypothetical protein